MFFLCFFDLIVLSMRLKHGNTGMFLGSDLLGPPLPQNIYLSW